MSDGVVETACRAALGFPAGDAQVVAVAAAVLRWAAELFDQDGRDAAMLRELAARAEAEQHAAGPVVESPGQVSAVLRRLVAACPVGTVQNEIAATCARIAREMTVETSRRGEPDSLPVLRGRLPG